MGCGADMLSWRVKGSDSMNAASKEDKWYDI
jgi:hypothetical protein